MKNNEVAVHDMKESLFVMAALNWSHSVHASIIDSVKIEYGGILKPYWPICPSHIHLELELILIESSFRATDAWEWQKEKGEKTQTIISSMQTV